MEKQHSQPKRSSRASGRGFTLLEVIVSLGLGLTIVSMGLSTIDTIRFAYVHDVVRTRMNQDLRSASDLIGISIRQAGEGFTESFPAIEVIQGASGAPDELIVRKEVLGEEPSVCANITAGSARGNLYFTNSTPTPGCAYSVNGGNYNAWRTHRQNEGGIATAYIYNTSSRQGEFFTYFDERNVSNSYYLRVSTGTWTHGYTVGTSQIYVLEELRFRLVGDELQLIENNAIASPWSVAYGISDLQVQVIMQNGTVLTTFDRTQDWTDIAAVQVSISGVEQYRGENLRATVTSRFFPRNVLSN